MPSTRTWSAAPDVWAGHQREKAFLIAVAPGDEYRLWHSYVRGQPEALRSRFAHQNVLIAVCRVLGTARAANVPGLTEQEIVDFLRSTFAAFQTGHSWSALEIQNAVQRLVSARLVEPTDEDRMRLTPLGEVAGQLGIDVESVVRVASGLRGVPLNTIRIETLLAAAQVTAELDQIYIPIHKKSTQERVCWQSVLARQNLPHSLASAIRSAADVDVTARSKRLAAALMWVQGVPLDQLEHPLLQHLPSDNAAGPIRSVADRTRDLVGVVARIAEILNPDLEAAEGLSLLVERTSVQLELGVPVELVWLARVIKRALTRGDYLALYRNGLADPSALLAADAKTVEDILPDSAKRKQVLDAAGKYLSLPAAATNLPMPKPPEA